MTRRTLALALTVLAPALVVAACKKGNESSNAATDSTTAAAAPAPAAAPESAAAPGTPAGVQPSTVTDPQIAAIVVAANSADSAAGEQAKTKSTNQHVKDFAQRMITDHGGVNKQAVALVTRLHVTPEPNNTSTQLSQGGEAKRQQFSSLSGAAFDKAYIDNEVEYHQTVLDAIDKTLIPSAQNADLKALLTQVRPAIAAHLDMAKNIQKELQGAK